MCGGTPSALAGVVPAIGLSPRVRGNHAEFAQEFLSRRSIPACAGEPDGHFLTANARWVYPRVCGGTQFDTFLRPCAGGLSPRVRGNRRLSLCRLPVLRSIPACAGEPRRRRPVLLPCRVYPRVCGGTINGMPLIVCPDGLSPRVRGNHGKSVETRAGGRSIPACAGEPFLDAGDHAVNPVYPRVCGGTRISSRLLTDRAGLSPRVRGNRKQDLVDRLG